ncbi:major facilitator superfamily domain-containing protein [Scheffersomyces xylosifermentans]|uniref:major facilitator superfamily domain-containing protein n=1 Tax=Scheffersomyces xylosifermentans TaxID=1304137 RepID=UPI00315CB7AB
MTSSNPPRNKWRIVTCVALNFTCGFSDAAPGALLPHIEQYYGIGYSVASLIWISSAIGFIFTACLSHKIEPWFGKRYALVLGCIMASIMYAIIASGTKYPAVAISFFFGGAGFAIEVAQVNVFISRFDKVSTYLSYLHGGYGIGATISPLIATSMVGAGIPWYYFYLVLLGIMILNCFSIYFSFEGADVDLLPWEEESSEPEGHLMSHSGSRNSLNDGEEFEMQEYNRAQSRELQQANNSSTINMILALKTPVTWLIAFFCLFYQGAEVSMAGWIVSFFLDYRHGNPKTVGYAASSFWGGLTIGRLALTRPLHKTLGSRRGIFIVSVLSIVLIGLVWAIPNVIAEAVIVALAGILIGPNYPLLIAYSAHHGLLPRKIQVVSITIMSAFGSSGGAIFPFIVGLLSQKVGTFVVLPVFIVLYSAMMILWVLLPNVERRKKQPSKEFTLWERFW